MNLEAPSYHQANNLTRGGPLTASSYHQANNLTRGGPLTASSNMFLVSASNVGKAVKRNGECLVSKGLSMLWDTPHHSLIPISHSRGGGESLKTFHQFLKLH